MAQGCGFCQIREGTTPAEVVYEDDHTLAFLDIRPVFPGHVLVIPKVHVNDLLDLPAEELEPHFRAVQLVAQKVREAMGAEGVFVASNNRVSQSVPHLHTHVVPRTKGDGLRGFFWPRLKYDSTDHLAEVAKRIRATF